MSIKAWELAKSISEGLAGQAGIEEAIVERNGLGLIPSSLALAKTEARIFDVPGRDHLLRGALEGLKRPSAFITDGIFFPLHL